MSPKRKAVDPAEPNVNDNGKKAKPAAPAASPESQDQNTLLQSTIKRRQQRWAEVSGSKNLDIGYQTAMQNPSHAYEFMCVCNPLDRPDAWSDEEDDGDTSEGNKEEVNVQACDMGKTCPCGKTAVSLPSHQYTMTRAGLARSHMAGDMMDLRNPDAFGMYTFNDHMAYGALEVVQNMLLDFDEAYRAEQWGEVWAVVEGVALFMLVGEGDTMCMADDGETIESTVAQIARMVLTALVALDGKTPFADGSDAKNLGCVIALYLAMANSMREQGVLEADDSDDTEAFQFDAGDVDLYLKSYAHRRGITVPGVADISEDPDLELPEMSGKDPWGWKKAFSEYQRTCAVPVSSHRGTQRSAIGGDNLDISTWSSAERKRASFDKKDPLPRNAIKKLKEGFTLGLA